ncbi:MAG: hypothetical protein F6K31_41495 [Symploca sp. SIO2G7]|nr:hypothetical protein [Symploca sp. SIO2G7]
MMTIIDVLLGRDNSVLARKRRAYGKPTKSTRQVVREARERAGLNISEFNAKWKIATAGHLSKNKKQKLLGLSRFLKQ